MDLAEQVEVLRARLVELVNIKQNFCDQEVIALSQELDVLLLLLQFKSKRIASEEDSREM